MMDHSGKYRGWIMAAALAVLLVGLLVMGLSFASAQTATPGAAGTAAATAVGTASVTGAATAAAPSAGTASPTRAATAGAAVTASLQISLPQQSYLPLNLAVQAANAALAQCNTEGYRVSVTIVDGAGNQKVVLKADGAGPQTVSGSLRKAFTAGSLGSPTSALVTRVQGDPTLAGIANLDDRIILLAGGLPIRANNQIVGGIGVAGAPSGTFDEACAQGGLNSLR
jgi:uncharacterized protein GlcG (DUF336 family)